MVEVARVVKVFCILKTIHVYEVKLSMANICVCVFLTYAMISVCKYTEK